MLRLLDVLDGSRHVEGPFGELLRTFTLQLFAGGSTGQEEGARRRVIWAASFLLPLGTFLLFALLPEYELAVLRARAGVGPAGQVDDLLVWIVFLFTTYAMAASGFVAVGAWDALTFDRADAAVLGTLPLQRSTVVGAKLGALALLLLAGSIPLNTINAVVFGMVTANQATSGVWASHFVSFWCATVSASILGFASIVLGRVLLSVVFGPRMAAACAAPLQFVCVVLLCSLIVLCPFVLDVSLLSSTFTNALPSGWFVGIFEFLRGSPRFLDPSMPFQTGAERALLALPLVLGGAIALSITEVYRQMRASISTRAVIGVFESARVARFVAYVLTWRNQQERGVADFAVMTIARNRAQRGPLAVASGLAVVTAGAALAHGTASVADLAPWRTAVLWIPLVVAYWTAIGVRAALQAPGETRASWAFFVIPAPAPSRTRAIRTVMYAFVVPRTLASAAMLVPVLGWSRTATHAVYVTVLSIVVARFFARSLDAMPFSGRGTELGSALKGRWAAYGLGLWGCAYLPIQIEKVVPRPTAVLGALVLVAVAGAVGWLVEMRWRAKPSAEGWQPEPEGGPDDATTLDLAGMART